ncbi:uncharacterized protein LOC132034681 [Lycium ferocissimum]|uniref:uncharacterized protein LOC132034681 n=1 Tax=Lycium ferocissimum TaxID=112874 RepID=UPI002815A9FF|nr:uncharacterized protein LOC132034681 [Lycium ferocissimum]
MGKRGCERCLESYLRCMTFDKPKEWPRWLGLLENLGITLPITRPINMSPYEVIFIQKPPPCTLPPFGLPTWTWLIEVSSEEVILRKLKFHLAQAQNRMKMLADKHRTERSFEVGDWVFVKLQPYRQLSLKDHSFQKLSSKFFGPFQVTATVGHVAYTLALPRGSKIHPTFHVSQLKKKIGSHLASTTLPEVHSDSGHILLTPAAILDRRLAQRRGKAITQVLVKWLKPWL